MKQKVYMTVVAAALMLSLGAGNECWAAQTSIHAQSHPWGTEKDFQTPISQSMVSDITGMAIDQSVHAQNPIAVICPTDSRHQPLYGIGSADIVYEFAAAGDLSEMAAVIQDWRSLPVIGEIGELKYYMTSALKEWDALLVHKNSDPHANAAISLMSLSDLSETQDIAIAETNPDQKGFLYRDDVGGVVTTAADLGKACESLGYGTGASEEILHGHFSFSSGEETLQEYGGAQGDLYSAGYVDLSHMFRDSHSAFLYDSGEKVYRKFENDGPQYDALTGEQLTFTNLVIQCVPYCTLEDGNVGAGLLQAVGEQYGYYITRGKAIPITWQKMANEERTIFLDRNGREIHLNPGKTYLAVAQADLPILLK